MWAWPSGAWTHPMLLWILWPNVVPFCCVSDEDLRHWDQNAAVTRSTPDPHAWIYFHDLEWYMHSAAAATFCAGDHVGSHRGSGCYGRIVLEGQNEYLRSNLTIRNMHNMHRMTECLHHLPSSSPLGSRVFSVSCNRHIAERKRRHTAAFPLSHTAAGKHRRERRKQCLPPPTCSSFLANLPFMASAHSTHRPDSPSRPRGITSWSQVIIIITSLGAWHIWKVLVEGKGASCTH